MAPPPRRRPPPEPRGPQAAARRWRGRRRWTPAAAAAAAELALLALLLASPGSPPGRLSGSSDDGERGLSGGGGGVAVVDAQVAKCHERCHKCHLFDYDMSWHCVECDPGYELWVDGCFLPCPIGQYRYGYECQPCTEHCNKCVGTLRHECTECANGYALDFRGLCVRDCREGFSPTSDGNSCEPCDGYCKTCLGRWRISCTSCYEGYSLRIMHQNTSSGECLSLCEKGFYRDTSTDLRCIQCSEGCADCDSMEVCFECAEDWGLYRGICYPTGNVAAETAIDFETYMNSGAGLSVPIDDPTSPKWKDLMENDMARRLREEEVEEERRQEESEGRESRGEL